MRTLEDFKTLDDFRKLADGLNKTFLGDNKWTFKVDGVNGQIKLRPSLCFSLLGLKARNKEKMVRKNSKSDIKVKLEEKGICQKSLDTWLEDGISLQEFRVLLEVCKTANKTAGVLNLIKDEMDELEFFVTLFKGFIPEEVIIMLYKDLCKAEQKETTPIQQSTPKPTIKRNLRPKKLAIKRLKPAYAITPNDLKELAISRQLAISLLAFREVPTPSGNIDLLTATKLIEVKSGENWKHGIGQLIAYGTHLPDKQLVLYLFDYQGIDLDNVRMVCNRVNIEVMLHQ